MDTKVLVAYASKHGATQEIAQKIGEVLTQAGLQVDVSPVDRVKDVESYQAVVFGSAVYIGNWQKEAIRFLKANEKDLAQRPVWLFSSGPTGEGDPVELLQGWRMPPALQPVVDRIKPRDLAVFHGSIAPEKLNIIEKQLVKGVKAAVGDFRVWEMITAWASGIADILQNAAAEP